MFTKKEQGSVLVIALGMGLLMTGVASFVLIKANSNKINTVSDQKTKQAVALTEGAASRYLELITKYPAIAVYCANGGTAPCDTGKNWSNLTVSDLTLSSSGFCEPVNTVSSSDITAINNYASTGWQTFPGNTQYRLINYTYKPEGTTPNNTAPGIATLILEGRTSSNSSDHRGTTRLEFQIPITANPNTTPCPMPGILAKSDGTIKVSPHSINAVVRRTGSAPPSSDFPNPDSFNGTTIYDGTTPVSVDKTTITVPNIPSTVSSPSNPYYTIGSLDLSNCSIRLPRKANEENAWGCSPSELTVSTADQPHSDGRYYYIIPSSGGDSIKLSNAAILIEPETGKKVVLYVEGKITISGKSSNGTSLSLTCEKTADPSAVPITTFINQGLPENLEMYGPTGTVDISDNSSINGFMLFPNAEVKVSQGLIAGAVWAKTFDFSNTSGCTVGMIQKSVGGVLAADFTLPPTNKINAVSSWRRVKTEN